MDLLEANEVATVVLFDIRLSESEVEGLADSLRYVLENLTEEQVSSVFVDEDKRSLGTPAETRSFAERMYKELMDFIKGYCREEFLQSRFKEWRIEGQKPDMK